MTFVSRVRVTGGFLAGLDLQFEPGLNVVVGPRGAGKTTLLELMRHALALSDGTQSSDRASFLRQVLGSGEVVLDLNTPRGAERLVVDADGAGSRPDLTAELALMLGQNELEEIADSPRRRLALVDLRNNRNFSRNSRSLQSKPSAYVRHKRDSKISSARNRPSLTTEKNSEDEKPNCLRATPIRWVRSERPWR